jgi:hypothetical protein
MFKEALTICVVVLIFTFLAACGPSDTEPSDTELKNIAMEAVELRVGKRT